MTPVELFRHWVADVDEPISVALATASPDGTPSVRMVLLKQADERGLVFFTNYESRKGKELHANPQAAVLLHIPGRQVRVEGAVSVLPAEESDAYWATRPLGSRVGAVASRQSEVLESRAELDERVAAVTGEPPRPEHWGGFLLTPHTWEFWEHRDDRLHDRVRYRRVGGEWVTELLYP